MAMSPLSADVRPAKIAGALSNVNFPAHYAVNSARSHLRAGNPCSYARVLAAAHVAADAQQQRAIEAVITSDGQARLFVRHPASGCLLAKEC